MPDLSSAPEGLATIGDLVDAGLTGLRIWCRRCGRESCVPFGILKALREETVGLVALRLSCRECRAPVEFLEHVTPWRAGDQAPQVRT
jgi:hypothetical protein